MPETILYVGPSGWGLQASLFDAAQVQRRPPARRRDIDHLLAEPGEPGTVVVCDGIFQSAAALSHAELCNALDAGWQVWGVSSIGAIRAWEMRAEGMRGWGRIYEMFARADDFTDDEVCQLHFPEPPYFAVSEALVNVRFALRQHAAELGIATPAGAALVDRLQAQWFGDRTPARIKDILVRELALDTVRADAFLDAVSRCRLKTLDLRELLEQRPWASPPTHVETP